ncbi:MAG TPA: hypothetical protein VN372_12220 [Methanospirillum sp.]|nr:hypothetical protein [Methanospirillum sp.]
MNNRYFYILTLIFLISAPILTGEVSAYYLTLDAPAEVRVGEPILVSGSTNIPPPDKVEVVLSHSINVPVEITRQAVEITDKGDTLFNVTFDTKGLVKGNYKIEATSQTQRDFSAGSRNLRVIKLTDRSDLIRFSSSQYQSYDGTLEIEAKIQGYEDNSIQMLVQKGETKVFGPESVPVTKGVVKYDLPLKTAGGYSVTFTDSKGLIGSYMIQVEGSEETTTSEPSDGVTNATITPEKTKIPTDTNEPVVTPTKTTSAKNVTQTLTPSPASTESKTSTNQTMSSDAGEVRVSAEISRDSPGYFLVTLDKTPVTIGTSANDDWVLEYKLSSTSAGVKVNENMKAAAEKVTISDDVKQVFLKVYPYSYKSAENVEISMTAAGTVVLSDEAAQAFGAPPRYGSVSATTTTKSPFPLGLVIISIIGSIFAFRRK